MLLAEITLKRLLLAAALTAWGTIACAAQPLRIDSVLLELIEQSDVPARDAGVIEAISVKEGDLVKTGDTLIQLDTAQAKLDVGRAKLEWSIAQEESRNEVDVRFARKSLEVAEAELQRAKDSVDEYPKSVSLTELDRLQLTVERTRLEIEQAEHVLNVAEMTAQLKRNELETAETKLARQTIRAPIDGVVAQIYRRHGEWVEPGQQVVRILRMDRLRVEGFVALSELDTIPVGAPIELLLEPREEGTTTFPGKLVHVSPEVDPVNDQVRLWAEVDNRDMQLKPGMRGAMLIRPEKPQPNGNPGTETTDSIANPAE